MTWTALGYGEPPSDLVGNPEARTKCDLSVPNKNAGERLAKIIAVIPDVTPNQAREIKNLLEEIDANFIAIEQWAGYFFRNCVCHCEETGGS